MSRLFLYFLMGTLLPVAVAQNVPAGDTSQPKLIIASLPPPAYPPIALAAHVFGDMELTVEVHPDGAVESITAVSGPPMLRQPAIESAKQTKFECRRCSEAVTSFHIVYRYALAEEILCPEPAKNEDSGTKITYPNVTQSAGMVVITGQPFGTCDYAASVPVRSAKCFFLWKCGLR